MHQAPRHRAHRTPPDASPTGPPPDAPKHWARTPLLAAHHQAPPITGRPSPRHWAMTTGRVAHHQAPHQRALTGAHKRRTNGGASRRAAPPGPPGTNRRCRTTGPAPPGAAPPRAASPSATGAPPPSAPQPGVAPSAAPPAATGPTGRRTTSRRTTGVHEKNEIDTKSLVEFARDKI